MARTKNTQPPPHQTQPSSQVPNFVLVCEAKPLQSRPARVKHVTHRRISGRMADSSSKTPPSNSPEPSTNSEAETNTPIDKTEHKKVADSSSVPKQSGRKVPTRSHAREINVKETPPISSKPSRKRKSTEGPNWRRKEIVVGTTYLPEEIKNLGWDILPFLNFQAWGNVVSLDDLVYVEQIREFYSNARFKMVPLEITSKIGDMEFTINAEVVGQALAIPNSGV